MDERSLIDGAQKAVSDSASKSKKAAHKALFSFKRKEAQAAFDKAKLKKKFQGLTLLQAPSELSLGKLLIVIPRKSGNAYERNRLKRQIKAIFYEEKLYKKPIISILIAYKQAMELSFDQIKEFLIKNLR